MFTNNSPVLIPIMLLAVAVIIPLIPRKRKGLAWYVAIITSATTVFIAIFNVFRVIEAQAPIRYFLGNWAPPVGIEYVLDHLSAFIIAVVNGVAFLVLVHAKKIVNFELPKKEIPFYATVLLMLCGFNGILITGDLFNLYVFLEISSLSLYGLIAVGERQSPVAAFRYLIVGTVAASFYLLGTGFLYVVTGSLNMADVKGILAQPGMVTQPAVLIALCLMMLGMAIKMALFPLHGWLPDAYTYAPSTTSAIVAPTGTKVGAYVMLRVMFFVFGVTYVSKTLPVTTIITVLAAIAIIYGSILAIAQREIKRMLAYSSIAQIGYIALGIGLANPLGLIGAVLHVLNHAFMKACLFLVTGNFRYRLGHSNVSKLTDNIRKKMPWTMAAFTVAALSMVGIPPTAGFFSKLFLVRATLENSNWILMIVILSSSLLNLVYFFRILERVYMKPIKSNSGDNEETDIERSEVKSLMLLPTLILAAGLIILGIFNTVIVKGIIEYIIPAAGM